MNVSSIGIKKAGSASQQFLTNLFVVTATVDPASLATVTGAVTAAITATGAALGDRVELFPLLTCKASWRLDMYPQRMRLRFPFSIPRRELLTLLLARGQFM